MVLRLLLYVGKLLSAKIEPIFIVQPTMYKCIPKGSSALDFLFFFYFANKCNIVLYSCFNLYFIISSEVDFFHVILLF